MIRKFFLGICLALSLTVLAACGDDGDSGDSGADDQQSQGAPGTAQEPDLTGLADVVAEVNGEEITKDEFTTAYEGQFQQLSAQAQTSGQPVDQDQLKKQVVESMVSTELLVQEADHRGFKATDQDVEKSLTALAQQYGMKTVKELFAAFEEQGVAEDAVRADVTNQVKIEQLIAEESGDKKPTEAQLRKLYRQAKAQQSGSGNKLPPFEKVRPQLEQQAKSEQQNTAARALVGKLRKKADVTINL